MTYRHEFNLSFVVTTDEKNPFVSLTAADVLAAVTARITDLYNAGNPNNIWDAIGNPKRSTLVKD